MFNYFLQELYMKIHKFLCSFFLINILMHSLHGMEADHSKQLCIPTDRQPISVNFIDNTTIALFDAQFLMLFNTQTCDLTVKITKSNDQSKMHNCAVNLQGTKAAVTEKNLLTVYNLHTREREWCKQATSVEKFCLSID